MGGQSVTQTKKDNARIDRLARLRPVLLTLIAVILGGVLMLTGGRWDWVEGWLLTGAYSILLIGSGLWTARYAPGLGRERAQAIARPGSLHERLMLIIAPTLLVSTIFVAALDGGRFRWSHVPLWVEIIGFGLVAVYIALNVWAATSNPFLSAVARVQEDRGHHVITTGPYQLVRHPMYLGVCLLGAAIPLALGSWWALIPGLGLTAAFVLRTAQEDRFLQRELPGYQEYAQRVRYRLIPGVW